MKLYISPTSPYARKCRIVAIERGITDQVQEVAVAPIESPASLLAVNPLSKVPALDRGDGTPALVDSPVICAYLDSLGAGPGLIPPAPSPAHWADRRLEALADGIMDTVVAYRFEVSFKTDSIPSQKLIDRWTQTVARTIAVLETEAAGFTRAYTLGSLSVAVALAYTRWRLPQVPFAETAPALTAWVAACEARHAFERTAPPQG
jgi:glutathione S-transferase